MSVQTTSRTFGTIATATQQTYCEMDRATNGSRNRIKRGVIVGTTNGSGVATISVPSRTILSAVPVTYASATATTFTFVTCSTITATTVGVVTVNGTAGGTALAGTIAVSVFVDYY